MGGIATDGALVDVQACGECGGGVGADGLQDFEQGQHPGGGSGHRKGIVPDTGRIPSGIRISVLVMTTQTPASHPANLVSIRIISDDVARLAEFYEQVTGTAVQWLTPDFVELATPAGTLAIGSTRTVALFGPGSARPADNHTAIIEFLVDDVDTEYDRIRQLSIDFVNEPTTMPWGNRSLLFRDPDGNLVNFFTPATPEAKAKFGR